MGFCYLVIFVYFLLGAGGGGGVFRQWGLGLGFGAPTAGNFAILEEARLTGGISSYLRFRVSGSCITDLLFWWNIRGFPFGEVRFGVQGAGIRAFKGLRALGPFGS